MTNQEVRNQEGIHEYAKRMQKQVHDKLYNTVYHKIYRKLDKAGILEVVKEGTGRKIWDKKYKSDGFMDLNIDRLTSNTIAMAHNYIQNGDVMADPDMEIEIDHEQKTAQALSFQMDGAGIYQQVFTYDDNGNKKGIRMKLKKDLNKFLNRWLTNLNQQGFFE